MIVAHRYEEARLAKLAELAVGDEVLDLGCSLGMNAGLLRAGRTVTGLDLEEPKGHVRYQRFLVGDVFELPRLDDGRKYDTIVAGEFIEHIERPYDLLRVLHGCLKPRGRLLLSTPNPMAPPVVVYEWAVSRRRFYTESHVYYFTPRWVKRMLEGCGFQPEETKGVGLWPLGLPCPVGLSYQVIYVASRAERS
jgi:2-polyprenyl-3-methyl-5-hydroxy-6-metoxy-1,4-benzoquinol methylase